MKKIYIILTTAVILAGNLTSMAQLGVGASALNIASGETFSTEGLVLQPTTNLALTNVNITRTSTAVNSINGSSILRVFNFSQPIPFTGTLGFFYQDISELNGNPEAALAFVFRQASDNNYITTVGGTLDIANNYISYPMTGAPILGVTSTTAGVALPAGVSDFIVKEDGGSARIEWQTSFEQNHDRFEVERSVNGINFSPIAVVRSSGISTGSNYVAYDNNPLEGLGYYRLLQYDKDGTVKIYGVKTLSFNVIGQVEVTAYPNPTANVVNLGVQRYHGSTLNVTVFNLQGMMIHKEVLQMEQGRRTYPVNFKTAPSKGNYIIKIAGEKGYNRSIKLSVL